VNVFGRLRAVRAVLVTGVALRCALWSVVAGCTVLAVSGAIDRYVPLTVGARRAMLVVAVLAAAAIALALAWRDRAVVSLGHVALWLEERFPSIEYRLVTAVETGRVVHPEEVHAAGWSRVSRRRVMRALVIPAVVVGAAVIATLVLPHGAVARIRSPHAGDALARGMNRSSAETRLAPLVAELEPPAYSGLTDSLIDEPRDIRALAGSALVLRGRGEVAGIFARAAGDSVSATSSGGTWSISLRVGDRPMIVRLVDRTFQRLVAVEPIADAVPVVTLIRPAHDTVLRTARGRVALNATISDDFGVATARFEYIVSSGEGETFTFRSGTLGAVRPAGSRAEIAAQLSLDALALEPGDVVHVRAVAADRNSVSGPGIGASDTRTIRIARAGEYDSVAVEAAAPSDEAQTLISERMLITLAEALERQRAVLARDSVIRESRSIGADQKRLRRAVGDVVFARLGAPSGEEHQSDDTPAAARTMQELLRRADSATRISEDPIDFGGGESPVVAVNTPLLEAYDAMWDASTALETGEPGQALPHMRRALAAIERARQAERVYLRGAPPPVVVDVSAARMQGTEHGAPSVRTPVPADTAGSARARRFARIVAQARRHPAAAIDSLLVLRIDALAAAPEFAAALHDAATAMRGRRPADAAAALAHARRLLAGAPVVRDSIARWGIVP
jgi:uncharacterized protein DUF4175